eukprot:scaffold1105_cov140-Isochrysis_galbana.AAC.13
MMIVEQLLSRAHSQAPKASGLRAVGREGGARCARPPSPPPNHPQSRRGPTTHTQTAQRRDRDRAQSTHDTRSRTSASHVLHTHTRHARAHRKSRAHVEHTHTHMATR